MAANDGYRRYVEAAAVLGQITRARAEEIMREIMSGGDVSRAQAQEWVDDMVDRSRKATESIVDMIRSEVANQMTALGIDPEDLARQAADILRRSADAGRRVMQDMSQSRAARGPSRPGSATTAPRSTAATVHAPTKKAPAKKAPPKKAPAHKAPGTTTASTKAAPKKAAPKKAAPAKSAAPKKAAAKGSAGKKTAAARPTAKKRGSGTTP